MSIDWSKPIQQTGKESWSDPVPATVLVVDSDNRLIKWERDGSKAHAFVNRHGKLIATLHGGVPINIYHSQQFVENVPEPPHDHIVLFRLKGEFRDGWKANSFDGEYLQTKDRWESWLKTATPVYEYRLLKVDID